MPCWGQVTLVRTEVNFNFYNVHQCSFTAATSAGMCDVDVRPALYSSVVVTGGNSLVQVLLIFVFL